MPLTNEKSIDAGRLLERCMGNSDLAKRLMNVFMNTLPVEKSAIQGAINSSDMAAIARTAHKLKGTASNMCADGLAEFANAVEQAARADQADLVSQHWFDLSSQIDMVMESLFSKDSDQ